MVKPSSPWPNQPAAGSKAAGPWGQANPASVPLQMGSHARPCTLAETMNTIIGRMEKGMRLVVSGSLFKVAIQGDPLTQPQDVHLGCGDEASVKTLIPDQDLAAVLGETEYSVYYLSRDIKASDFDRTGSFWSNAYFLSLSPHRFISDNTEGFQARSLGGNVNRLDIPFNLAIALFKYRTEQVKKLWGQIDIEDEYGFENQFVTTTGLAWPDPTRKPPVPEEQHEDIGTLKERLAKARQEIDAGAEGLRERIKKSGGLSAPILSDFGLEIENVAISMTRLISRDQHASDVATSALRADLKEVAEINFDNLSSTFLEPTRVLALTHTLQQIEDYKPGVMDSLAFWRPSVETQKADLKRQIAEAEAQEKEAKKNKANELQIGVDRILDTTQKFRSAAKNRMAIMQGQDMLYDDVLELLDTAVKIMEEVGQEYDDGTIERDICSSRVANMADLKDSVVALNDTNYGLMRLEVTYSDDVARLGTRLTKVLLRIIQAEALQRTTTFKGIAGDTGKIERDVFGVAETIAGEFKTMVENREAERAAIAQRAREARLLTASENLLSPVEYAKRS